MKTQIITCLFFFASLSWSIGANRPPNVLMIAADDLNDWIACLGGHPQVQTPHLDRLAARGMLFHEAHAQAPLCNPSRVSVLTGKRPGTTGIYGLAPWFRSIPALRETVTLPQAFRSAGYRSAIAGKIFHSFPPPQDREAEFEDYGPACNFGPLPKEKLVRTPSPMTLVDWGVFPKEDSDQNDYQIASWMVERLLAEKTNAKEAPFFYAVGFGRPHLPCFASQKWFDLYPEESLAMPPWLPEDRSDTPLFSWYLHWKLPEPRLSWLQQNGQWKPLVRSYLASISFMDAMVGRVLDALDQSGEADRTLIVFWSDQGWHLGEKGISGKNSLWNRSTRVPLIFAGPGIIQGDYGDCVELLDLFPTLLDLCGIAAPSGLEGRSLRQVLESGEALPRRAAITTHNPGNHSVKTPEWRFIRYADASEELYDCRLDPNEWHNLAPNPKYAAIRQELAAQLPPWGIDPVPGSEGRILFLRDGKPTWEGQIINPDDPIPEL